MSDKMRWRWGNTNPVVRAVDSATVIEIGDLLYEDMDEAKPASSQVDQLSESETANQELFADNFLGVAMQRSRSGDTDPIQVAITGVFEFDCGNRLGGATFDMGDLVGPYPTDERDGLFSQRVVLVSNRNCAIARVAKRVATPATSVFVDIRSTVMTGGIHD